MTTIESLIPLQISHIFSAQLSIECSYSVCTRPKKLLMMKCFWTEIWILFYFDIIFNSSCVFFHNIKCWKHGCISVGTHTPAVGNSLSRIMFQIFRATDWSMWWDFFFPRPPCWPLGQNGNTALVSIRHCSVTTWYNMIPIKMNDDSVCFNWWAWCSFTFSWR